jgi:hypothetical protein
LKIELRYGRICQEKTASIFTCFGSSLFHFCIRKPFEASWRPDAAALSLSLSLSLFSWWAERVTIVAYSYENGQEYKPHYDYFSSDHTNVATQGNRMATVLLYLSDVEEGGETIFPNAAQGPLQVAPKKVRTRPQLGPHFFVCSRTNLNA